MGSEKIQLRLEPRHVTGKAVYKLRRQGIMPVAICGKGVEPYSGQVNEREFERIYRHAGLTSLVEISMEGHETKQAFIQEIHRHPVTQRFLHADFYVVDMRSEVTHEVPVVLVGENPLVERGDAVANLALPMLTVRSLPGDLPHQIDIDLSTLTEIDSVVHVRDLNFGDKVQVMTPADEVVLSLTPARMEVEEVVTETEEAEPELVREERKDDDKSE